MVVSLAAQGVDDADLHSDVLDGILPKKLLPCHVLHRLFFAVEVAAYWNQANDDRQGEGDQRDSNAAEPFVPVERHCAERGASILAHDELNDDSDDKDRHKALVLVDAVEDVDF